MICKTCGRTVWLLVKGECDICQRSEATPKGSVSEDIATIRYQLIQLRGIGQGFGVKEIIDGADEALIALDRLEVE